MTRAPGRIGASFDDILPPRLDGDPMAIQEGSEFKRIVAEVGRVFNEIERGQEPDVNGA